MNRVHAIVAGTVRIAEPVFKGRKRARAWIETVQAMRGRCQPQHTARFFCDRAILGQALWLGAIPPELLGRRIEAVQAKIRCDPQRSAPIDPQSFDIVVAQRPRIGCHVSIDPVPAGTRIEAHQTVAASPEPQIATAVLRNCAHTPPEDRFVITGDLIRPPVNPVQPTVRPDPQSVTIFHIRRSHGALVKAVRVSPLVAVRPETRTLGLEAINIPGLGRRPKAVFTISVQPNDKVPAQSVGIVRIALIPDRLLAVPCQLHQAQFVGAEPECPVLILLNGHNSGRRIRRQSRALERIHRDFAARRINTGQITAGPQTHPNHSSAVLKRLCRETRAAELPSRTCLKPDVPRDLAGAPIESKEARTTGDPKTCRLARATWR